MEDQRPTEPDPRSGRAPILAEWTVVLATIASLAGTTGLVISMYQSPPRPSKPTETAAASPPSPAPIEVLAEVVSPASVPPTTTAPEAIDPTPAAIAQQTDREQAQKVLASQADQAADALEAARRTASKTTESARRAAAAIRTRAAELREQADHGAIDAEMLALERDMLAREIDRKKADLARAQARAQNGYAIQPYRGPNGTWRCPIVVECSEDTLAMPPTGPTFSTTDLGRGPSELRAFLVALNRASAQVTKKSGPDGVETVPYVLFVVRPDGIRPYYAAKALLEPLGVAFGYELVGQGVEVDYPDLGDPASWPDAGPLGPAPGTHPGWGRGQGGLAQGAGGLGDLARLQPPRHLVSAGRLLDDEDPYETPGSGLGTGEGPKPGGRPTAGRAGLDPPSSGFVPRGRALNELSRSGEMPGGRPLPNLAPRAMPGTPNLAGMAPPPSGRGTGNENGNGTGNKSDRPRSGSAGSGTAGGSPSSGGSPGIGEPRRLPIVPSVPARDLELVVVCSRDGVLLHPGAYRLSSDTLKAKPDRLAADLQAIVMAEQIKRRGESVAPRLRFLVQTGGQATFELARGQTLSGGIHWPSRIQVANADPLRLTRGELEP